MFKLWNDWLEAVRFAQEAQSVIWMRWLMFASGQPHLGEEARRMVAEKIAAFSDSEIAAARALSDGQGFYAAAVHAYHPLRRAVHANNRRLLRSLH